MRGFKSAIPWNIWSQNRGMTADVLLSITDTQIGRARNKIVIATYKKVRKSVKGDVEAAVPGLAQIIHNHAQS